VSGQEAMIGQIGIAKTDLDLKGQVHYGGELWNAEASQKILKGQEVEIIAVENLKLIVKRKEG
jgi:membrane-bound ClpP family serine protease